MKIFKEYKYLFILLGGLFLFLFGSVFGIIMAYIICGKGMGMESFSKIISYFGSYYSDVVLENGEVASQFVQNYFANNPQDLETAKYANILIQVFAYIPLLIFFAIFLIRDFIYDFIDFGKDTKKNFLKILMWFGILYAASYAISIVYQILNITGQSDNESLLTLMMDSDAKILFLITIVIIGPFVEEVLYRKLIFDTVEKTFKLKPIFAIVISVLIFALIHVSDAENIIYVFQYIAMAIPITLSYHLSKNNLFVSYGVHVCNNLLVAIGYLIMFGI